MIQFSFFCDDFSTLAFYFQHHTPLTILSSNDKSNPSFLFLLPIQEIEISNPTQPWEELKAKLNFDLSLTEPLAQWSGFLSYELGAYSDSDKTLQLKEIPIPLAYFFRAACVICYQAKQICISLFDEEHLKLSTNDQKLFNQMCKPSYWEKLLQQKIKWTSKSLQAQTYSLFDDQKSYISKIEKAKEYILSGDVYQVNLSTQMQIKTDEKAFDIFIELCRINPTPFAALIRHKDYQIISASPERFLKFEKGKLRASPIKGTIAKGSNAQENLIKKLELLSNPKEDAELMMICDLMRNDLGKVSEIGSVECMQKKQILEFSNLFHLQSNIVSKAKQLHPIDLLRAAFPSGSISGCPKIRALEVICEIEQRARHIYCGSIGYFCTNGDFDFNVAIRTALLKDQLLHVQMGGAITYDSIPIKEYEEILHKANPFFKIFNLDFLASKKQI